MESFVGYFHAQFFLKVKLNLAFHLFEFVVKIFNSGYSTTSFHSWRSKNKSISLKRISMPNASPKRKEKEKEERKQEGPFYNYSSCRKKTILFDHVFVINFASDLNYFKHKFLC